MSEHGGVGERKKQAPGSLKCRLCFLAAVLGPVVGWGPLKLWRPAGSSLLAWGQRRLRSSSPLGQLPCPLTHPPSVSLEQKL